MAYFILGFFAAPAQAEAAAAELKDKGYVEDLSVIAKDRAGGTETRQVRGMSGRAFVEGAEAGGVIGLVLGTVADIISFAVPGIGSFSMFGPLALVWGVTGAALGALSGGFIGAFVDMGLPAATAAEFEDRLKKGQVLLAVTGEKHREAEVKEILEKHEAEEINVTD